MPTEEYILSLSYGKDSMACLRAIELLGLPLHRIITADVWATDTIPADPPPMVEFKTYADAEIKRRWGIEVEHFCARNPDGTKRTYEQMFYRVPNRKPGGKFTSDSHTGFPYQVGAWCNDRLKVNALNKAAGGGY
jgi:3'-phosphoadenosine 5'-phosphosulfate sulfotransferase (PAPS reductase)/FAD synthetase